MYIYIYLQDFRKSVSYFLNKKNLYYLLLAKTYYPVILNRSLSSTAFNCSRNLQKQTLFKIHRPIIIHLIPYITSRVLLLVCDTKENIMYGWI